MGDACATVKFAILSALCTHGGEPILAGDSMTKLVDDIYESIFDKSTLWATKEVTQATGNIFEIPCRGKDCPVCKERLRRK